MDIIWEEKGRPEQRGQEEGESLWVQNNPMRKRSKPQEDMEVEVAVIGAGLAGVLTAYHIKEEGIEVAVLEANTIGGGITKNTTAKISSQHGLIYRKLLLYSGEEKARLYAEANQHAIESYKEIINKHKIDCDYETLPSYIYSRNSIAKIYKEVEAAKKLGLPARFTRDTALPFKIEGAIRFDNQAQFHPIKFLNAISKNINIYENTRVTRIYNNGLIETEKGRVKAEKIIIASHYPFINRPGYYFLKLHQERAYLAALSGQQKDMPQLKGMYLDEDKKGYTFRSYKNMLIFGGAYHRTGKYQPLDAYVKLENAAKRWFPNTKLVYKWSTQDCMTPDSLPYIGLYSSKTPNIFVATGFNKWGMTGSMVAANMLKDMVVGIKNPYQKIYNPQRFMPLSCKEFVKDAAIVTVSLLAQGLKIPHDCLEKINKGEAGVIRYQGQRIGVYRESNDKYYYVSTKCPHLGCKLEWNQNEKTWDCPCHGSRFDYKGKLINNPATRNAFECHVKKRKN